MITAVEDNPRRLQKRIKKITLGSSPDLSFFRLQTDWPRVDQGGLEKLDLYLSENPNTRLVIIDTLKMWRSSKGSNKGIYDQDYESLAPLRELSDKHSTAILVTHHNNDRTPFVVPLTMRVFVRILAARLPSPRTPPG